MNKSKLSLIFLALLVIVATSCKSTKKQVQTAAPVPVVPFTVQSGNVIYYDTYPGTVVANNEVQLRSEVSGFVTGIYFREGSDVTKGTKLYEIDRRKYQAAYDVAKAAVEIANANLKKSQRDADRYAKLDEQNAIAKQVLDDAQTALKNTQMQVKSSTANLLNAETDYNYSIIKAPFTGSIGLSQVKPGAFVTAGQTLLNTISSVDPIAVDFVVDENTLPYLVKLQNERLTARDSIFKVTLPDNSDYQYTGKLDIIDRAVDPQTGTIKIRTLFQNPQQILRPGMNCKVKVLNAFSGTQINIPVKAMLEQMGEYYVYLINKNDTVKQKRIEIGPIQGDLVVVTKGLNSGDKIVLEGIQKVHEGAVVVASEAMNNSKGEAGKADQTNAGNGKDKNGIKDQGKESKGKETGQKEVQNKGDEGNGSN